MTLLDTSGIFSYHDVRDLFHYESVPLVQGLNLLTHSYILDEFVALTIARRLPRTAALSFSQALLSMPNIDVIWVDENLHRRALSLLESRLDKTYSLCDAVSFILMRDYELNDALTTDHHFEQEGFVRLLK